MSYPELKGKHFNVAYLTSEILLHERIPTYSGGLGVVAGSMVRTAEVTEEPLIAVSLYPSYGYYHQGLHDNQMSVEYYENKYKDMLQWTGIEASIMIEDTEVWIRAWRPRDQERKHTDVLLLDTDYERNEERFRIITRHLYGGKHVLGSDDERWLKIAQAMVLGIGGLHILRAAGVDIDTYHLNESHAAFLAIRLLGESIDRGMAIEDAIVSVREKVVFTTHTPIPAGNAIHNEALVVHMGHHYRGFTGEILSSFDDRPGDVCMTPICLKLARDSNAVAKSHGKKAREMWNTDEIISITNGVSINFWQYPEFTNAKFPKDIQHTKENIYKPRFFDVVESRTGLRPEEGILTLSWFRRFAHYKRPGLLFYPELRDTLRFALEEGKLQIIVGGKPHPDDNSMQQEWNWIYQLSKELPNVHCVPNYDLELMKLAKAGSDVWLNTPYWGSEACGTSGMSASLNGALNLTIKDGWQAEVNEAFFFGSNQEGGWEEQYRLDARSLMHILMWRVIPMYYGDHRQWYEMAHTAMKETSECMSGHRMFGDYIGKLYTNGDSK